MGGGVTPAAGKGGRAPLAMTVAKERVRQLIISRPALRAPIGGRPDAAAVVRTAGMARSARHQSADRNRRRSTKQHRKTFCRQTSHGAAVVIDWTEFDADDPGTLVASLVTSYGRSTPLNWLTVWKDELENPNQLST